MKKLCSLLLSMTMLFCVAGCEKDETKADTEVQYLAGYMVIEEDGLHFDEVEIVTKDDTERIKELGLEEQADYPDGYAIINENQEEEVFEFADEVNYEFTDVHLTFIDESEADSNRIYKTNSKEEFLTHLGEYKLNEIPLSEQKIPYFIEVQNGKVISVTEKFEYTI